MPALFRIRPLTVLALAALSLGTTCITAEEELAADRAALADARRRWERAGTDSYQMDLAFHCFCLNDASIRVRVEDGQVVSRTFLPGGEPVQDDVLSDRDTVEELFDFIDGILDREPYRSYVVYNDNHGTPREGEFDVDRDAVDDEFGFQIRNFTLVAD